jgi:hypothetical protein
MSAALAITDPRLGIGGNNPPEPTPFEVVRNSVDAVFEEAKHWLDGGKVQSQAEADAIAELLSLARQTDKDASKAKEEEKRPYLDANKAIEERFKPVVSRIVLIADACKAALRPWEEQQEALRRQAAESARKAADEKAAAAQAAVRAALQAGIEEREAAERLLRESKQAAATATKAENAKSTTKVGGRTVSMRTTYRAVISDPVEFIRFAWKDNLVEITEALRVIAQREVSAGKRTLPGVTISEERSAV